MELQLRVGLNSGEVIAGEIGSGPFGYTAVGEQVGMAQRMESVAPPGGVMRPRLGRVARVHHTPAGLRLLQDLRRNLHDPPTPLPQSNSKTTAKPA